MSPDGKSARAARRAAKTAETSARPKKRGRWKRVLLVVLLLAVALRSTVLGLLPSIVAGLAEAQGLRCEYERLDLSLLGMDVELAHLDLAMADGTDPFVRVEYLRADVAVLALFVGDVVVRRLEIDGLDIALERDAEGRIGVLDGMRAAPADADGDGASGSGTSDADEASGPWTPPPLSSPVRLDALRVQNLRVDLHDRSVQPELVTRLEGDVRLSDLGSSSRPLRASVTVSARDVLDRLSFEIEAAMPGDLLAAKLGVHGRGVRPQRLVGYLEPAGLRPVAGTIDLDLVARANLARREGDDPQLSGTFTVDTLRLLADGRPALESGPLSAEVRRVTDAETALGDVRWTGLRARAEKRPEGWLRVAGFDLVGGAAASPEEPKRDEPPTSGAAPVLRLDELSITDLALDYLDGSVTPAVPLALRLDELLLRGVDTAPADPTVPIGLDARVRLPGVLSALTLGVQATPFADDAQAALRVDATGIAPDVLRPYLDAAGIESELRDGRLVLALDAGWTIDADGALRARAHLDDVALHDGEALLLALGGLDLDRLDVSSDGATIDVGTLALAGLRASATKDATGALLVSGLRLLPTRPGGDDASTATPGADASAPAERPSGATADATTPDDAPPLRLRVGALRWSDNQVAFRDESFFPPAEFALDDVGIELTQLALDTDPAAPFPLGTSLRAWLSAPGVVESLELSGAVRPKDEGGARIDLALRAGGLRPDAAKPVLDAAGIVSELSDGRLALDLGVDLAQEADALALDVALRDLALRDGERELLGLDAIDVSGLRSAAGRLDLGAITIARPRLSATRDAQGDLHALGLRVLAQPLPPPPDAREDAADDTAAAPAPAQNAPRRTLLARRMLSRPTQDEVPAADAGAPGAAGPASVTTLTSLALRDLTLGWRDEAVAPSADLSLAVDLDVRDVVLGEPAPPLSLALHVRVPDVLDDLSLTGTVQPDPADLVADLAFALEGLREGPLAAYLPPDLALLTDAGRLAFDLDARVTRADGGGQAVRVALGDLVFADGERTLARLGELSLDAPRLDAASGRFEVDALRLLGVEADVEQGADGRLRLLGLALGSATPPTPEGDGAGEVAADARPAGAAGDGLAAADAARAAPPDATAPAPAPDASSADLPLLPDLRLGAFELGVARLTVTDRSLAGAVPLEVRDFGLVLQEPFTFVGADPEASSRLALLVSGSAAPVLGMLRLDLSLRPFAVDPGFDVVLDLEGLRGSGITEAFPALAAQVDGSQLEDGRFHAELGLQFAGARRHALDFVPASGVTAKLQLSDVSFRDGPDGEVLLGLDELSVEADRIAPRRNLVHLGRVEIVRPVARVTKSPEATTLLDLRLLPPPPVPYDETSDGDAATLDGDAPEPLEAGDAVAASDDGTPGAATPPLDLRVSELSMSGLDVRFIDTSTYPPLDLPLDDLELFVRGFSTQALETGTPIKFHLFLGFGTVDDWRTPGSGDTLVPVGEFLVDGRLGLGAHPTGWTKVRLDGVSLPAFAGPARAAGVELQDGVFDGRVEVRFLDDATIDTRSTFVFTDLDMSEPDDGPISKYLLLPAPLDTVIFLLRDEAGAITIPLNLSLDEGQLSLGEVTSVATATLGRLIANAVASSPFRVVAGVGDVGMGIGGLLGLVDDDAEAEPEPPVGIAFPPASVALGDEARAALAKLVERLRDEDDLTLSVRHELGRADLEEAERRANPPASDAQQVATGLRQRKLELIEERAQVAARARTASLARMDSEQRALGRRLGALDRELGLLELSLDHVLDLLRPGAERRAARRTREAALAVAALRLADAREQLLLAADPDEPEEVAAMHERVRVQRPRFADDPEMPERGRLVIELARRRLE